MTLIIDERPYRLAPCAGLSKRFAVAIYGLNAMGHVVCDDRFERIAEFDTLEQAYAAIRKAEAASLNIMEKRS